MNRVVNTNIVIGTRGSELACVQAQLVAEGLRTRWADLTIETKIIRTSGDESPRKKKSLAPRAGRKGLFTAQIERALVERKVDVAVHSAKDLPSELARGTEIAAVLRRASVEDVLVSNAQYDLNSLPADGIVATGSVRRKHQLGWKRPDLEVVDLHGNVPTRLRALGTSQWHAAILARAGLERLGLERKEGEIVFEGRQFSAKPLSREIFLPAGGQGVIAMQIRANDERVRPLLQTMNDFDTRLCLRAEREFLRLLHGDCDQPVGVLATVDGAMMRIRAQIFELGATTPRVGAIEGQSEDAERLAAELLRQINVQ